MFASSPSLPERSGSSPPPPPALAAAAASLHDTAEPQLLQRVPTIRPGSAATRAREGERGTRRGPLPRAGGWGFLPPLCTTQSFPSLGAWAQNKAKADQAEPLRNAAGVWRQKGWDQRGGCEGDPSWGRTLQVKKGKKRPRSQGPGREGE